MNTDNIKISNSVEIANALTNAIIRNKENNNISFVPGWSGNLIDRERLAESILELYNHPRKNREIIKALLLFVYTTSGKADDDDITDTTFIRHHPRINHFTKSSEQKGE